MFWAVDLRKGWDGASTINWRWRLGSRRCNPGIRRYSLLNAIGCAWGLYCLFTRILLCLSDTYSVWGVSFWLCILLNEISSSSYYSLEVLTLEVSLCFLSGFLVVTVKRGVIVFECVVCWHRYCERWSKSKENGLNCWVLFVGGSFMYLRTELLRWSYTCWNCHSGYGFFVSGS